MKLRHTLFLLPNLLTAASLFFGIFAITRCAGADVTNEDVYAASLLLFYAFLFDLFDGRVARLTRTQSRFGVEFDSLADLISFGVAPAIIVYRWSLEGSGLLGIFVAFVYVLGGALRLARFNVLAHSATQQNPGKYMCGLPIPMAAAFIVAFVVASRAMEDGQWPWLTAHGLTVNGISYPMICVAMVVLALLMVSSVPFRSFKDFKIRNPFSVFALISTILISGVLWFFYSPAYILIGLLLMYVTVGLIEALISLFSRGSGADR